MLQVQANYSVMCGYFCIGFIYFMLAGKKLTDFTNMFPPYEFNKNELFQRWISSINLKQKFSGKQPKIMKYLCHQFFFCVSMYKMCQISNQAYGKCEIEIINDKEYF